MMPVRLDRRTWPRARRRRWRRRHDRGAPASPRCRRAVSSAQPRWRKCQAAQPRRCRRKRRSAERRTEARRALAALPPDLADAALSADARLVLEEHPHALALMCICSLFSVCGALFEEAYQCSGRGLGSRWLGRAFWREKPRRRRYLARRLSSVGHLPLHRARCGTMSSRVSADGAAASPCRGAATTIISELA